ncbi:efflux RND transporter periplasmic adaptor subunit [Prosthecochloris sp. ZM_2]|uniref:efflux RND transporter periplasmic adaptor subunit n=1 Tax=Prosthecochloris sp. ZM_2 TaxID=2045206 RepID=UPI000DF76606|nr:efflux RND transporter periplasmic adaptor subunit [Prosthecochloris sp. ZM_2]RNA64356.1 efflux RND transporter periplasmic adaptor subunit [Prosthecochloris sp. ZM_2]
MKTVKKLLPKYTIALGVIFAVTVIVLMTRGNIVQVDVLEVEKMQLVQAVYATGFVDADTRADLRAEVSGTVGEVRFREGDQVRAGEVIAVFDEQQPELAVQEAQAVVDRQRSLVRERRTALERYRSLIAAGAVSRQEYDDTQYSYEQAVGQLEQVEAQYRRRRDDLAKLQITAPVDGVLIELDMTRGDYITANTLVAKVVDPSSYVINAEIDELDVPKIEKGQKATVAFDALPEQRFAATVDRLVPQTDRITKTSGVYLGFDEPVGGVQAGMTATANIIYHTREGALLVPRASVVSDNGGQYVWKIVQGRLGKQPITVGSADLTHVEVTDGLAEGDLVVATPEERFREGMDADFEL